MIIEIDKLNPYNKLNKTRRFLQRNIAQMVKSDQSRVFTVVGPAEDQNIGELIYLIAGNSGIDGGDIRTLPVDQVVTPEYTRSSLQESIGAAIPALTLVGTSFFRDQLDGIGRRIVWEKVVAPHLSTEIPTLIVLQYPSLHDTKAFYGIRDPEIIFKELSMLDRQALLDAYTYSATLDLLTKGLKQAMLAQMLGKHVIVNLIDDSYERFAKIGDSFSGAGFSPLRQFFAHTANNLGRTAARTSS